MSHSEPTALAQKQTAGCGLRPPGQKTETEGTGVQSLCTMTDGGSTFWEPKIQQETRQGVLYFFRE